MIVASQPLTGDAMVTQRNLSIPIVEVGRDYLWMMKDIRPTLCPEIELLFAPAYARAGWPAPAVDFTTARTIACGPGRIEDRRGWSVFGRRLGQAAEQVGGLFLLLAGRLRFAALLRERRSDQPDQNSDQRSHGRSCRSLPSGVRLVLHWND